VIDRTGVTRWVAAYEEAWRTPGTDGLARLFTSDAIYRHSPYEEPVIGLADIRQMWEDDRDSAQEIFTLATEIIAVEAAVAVVRAEVRYGDPIGQEYRDLWVVRFDDSGRCREFEEWPFWPGRSYSARDNTPRS
jgi:hypothetical protein